MKRYSTFVRCGVVAAAVVVMGGCDLGGKEGDRCNPLVLRDECNAGLHCRLATCAAAYCCPTDRASSDPNCNAPGCPDNDGGVDAAADSPPDAPLSD
jgi:hypothetical protein